MWFAVALVAAWMVGRVVGALSGVGHVPAYLLACFLLAVTLVLGSGAGTAASMKGWITVGGVRLGQPVGAGEGHGRADARQGALVPTRGAPIRCWISGSPRSWFSCPGSWSWRSRIWALESCSSASFSQCCSGRSAGHAAASGRQSRDQPRARVQHRLWGAWFLVLLARRRLVQAVHGRGRRARRRQRR